MPLDFVAEVRCFFGRDGCEFKRELQNPIDAGACHHRLLGHEFTVGIREHPAAHGRIFAFGVFPHHPEIDVAGLAARERRRHSRHQPHRTKICILVELSPEFDQRAPQGNVIGNFRWPADRAEVNRIVLADLFLPVVRHHLAVLFVIVVGSEVEMIEMHGHAVLLRRRLDDAQALRHDLLADPVAGNDRDPVLLFFLGHREIPSGWGRFGKAISCWDCNGPKSSRAQRCSAMLTAAPDAA